MNYTPIPNELIEKLARAKLNGSEFRCVLVVLRKTLGWGKRFDYISLSQFERMTGILKPNVRRSLKGAIKKKILLEKGKKIGLNLDFINSDKAFINSDKAFIIFDNNNEKNYKNNYKQKNKKELIEAYKKGDRTYVPLYHGRPMRYLADQKIWQVWDENEWKTYVDSEDKIEFKKRKFFLNMGYVINFSHDGKSNPSKI
jgi:phage replication O-like protein O